MDALREFGRRARPADNLAVGLFAITVIYTILRGTAHTVLLGLAFVLMMLGALPKQMALAFLVGATVILLIQTSGGGFEGFMDGSGGGSSSGNRADVMDLSGSPPPAKTEGFSENRPMLPDNADRKEMLELGKPYKLPSEKDDEGVHLDAGTTFLNAYKALKPDQIAAMTRDTQDLLATQKSLMQMLDSFGPLMKDMSKITGFFGSK
jgi:hypothetical protein